MTLPEIPGYAYDELIGEGTCGYVYRCTGSTGEERAVKILRTLAINPDLVGTMYGRLSRAPSHPGISRIHSQNFGAEPFYYAMTLYGQRRDGSKFWDSPTLEDVIGRLSGEQALSCVDQLAAAIAFLHRHDIVHTGLKPNSIFALGDESRGFEIRVTDIGQGYVMGPQYLEMGDSGFYASPEQLAEGDYEEGAGRRWDVYAFGVIAYRLMTGQFPRLETQHRSYLKEKAERAKDPATVFGDLANTAASEYHRWLQSEPTISWPREAANDTERARRSVIERCLHLDPESRFADMREVVDEMKTRDHQIVLARVQQTAQEGEARAVKSAGLWKKGTVATGIAAGVVALFALFSAAQWQITKKRMDNQAIQGTETMKEEREKFESALDELESENQTHISEVSNSAEEFRATAEKAEALLSHAQRNGDRFFELVLDSDESDLPGFESKRRMALIKGQKYYEEVAGVLGREPGQAQTTAQAYRFLGAIYREQGNLRDAEAALRQSRARYEVVNQGEAGRGPQGLINLQRLAKVDRDLARVLVMTGNPSAAVDAETALQESDAIWRGLLATDETNTEFRLEIARNDLLLSEVLELAGNSGKEQLLAAQRSADSLVRLQEKLPYDDQLAGLLGDAMSRIGDLLARNGQRNEALMAFEKAGEIYAQAAKLNGAIERYQFNYGKMLGEVARANGDPEKMAAASQVLGFVASEHPENVEIQAEMAHCWGTLAEWQRDGGKASEALTLEIKATDALEPLILGDGANETSATPRARFILASRLCHLSELQGDDEKFKHATSTIAKALSLLEPLVKAEPTNGAFRRKLAEAYGLAGFANAKAEMKTEAKNYYELASEEWQELLNTNAADAIASDGLNWVKKQLVSVK